MSIQKMTTDKSSEVTLSTLREFVSTEMTSTVFITVCHFPVCGPKKYDNSYKEDECIQLNE